MENLQLKIPPNPQLLNSTVEQVVHNAGDHNVNGQQIKTSLKATSATIILCKLLRCDHTLESSKAFRLCIATHA